MFEFISRIFTSGSTVPEAAPQPAQEGRSEFIKPVKRKKVHMPPSPCEDTKRIAYDPFPWTSTIEGTIKIDPRGEVTLLIGNEERRFRVSRCAMRLGSPVWKKMFSGHFAEAESDVVKFPADDTEPMQVLLLIAHAQHQRLPDRLTLQQIASVAQVADKYEMAPKAKIFIENWIDKIDPGIRKHGWDFEYSEDPGKVMADGYAFIWIGWALRNSFIFYEGLHYVIWCTPPVHLAEDVELPPGCREFMFQWCNQWLAPLINAVYEPLEAKYDDENLWCYHADHVSPQKIKRCRLLRRGLAVDLLMRLSLPLCLDAKPEVMTLAKSARDVRMTFEDMFSNVATVFGGYEHDSCLNILQLDGILEEICLERYDEIKQEFSHFFEEEKKKTDEVGPPEGTIGV